MELVIIEGGEKGKVLPLKEGSNVLGRGSGVDIVLPSSRISRRHAVVIRDGMNAKIIDLNSSNGTFVNDQKVVEKGLNDGDRIRCGEFLLLFRPKGVRGSGTLNTGVIADQGKGEMISPLPPYPSKEERSKYRKGVTPSEEGIGTILPPAIRDKIKRVDIRYQVAGLFALLVLLVLLLNISRILDRNEEMIEKLCLERVKVLIRVLAEKNGEFIKNRNDIYLDTESIMEEGIEDAYLLDTNFRVLHPPTQRGQRMDKGIQKSIMKRVKEEGGVIIEKDHDRDGVYHVATMITVWSHEMAKYEVCGVAYLVYNAKLVKDRLIKKGSKLLGNFILLLILGGVVCTVIIYLFSSPLRAITGDLRMVIKRKKEFVQSPVKFKELEELVEEINWLIKKKDESTKREAKRDEDRIERRNDEERGIEEKRDEEWKKEIILKTQRLDDAVLIIDSSNTLIHTNRKGKEIFSITEEKKTHILEIIKDREVLSLIVDGIKGVEKAAKTNDPATTSTPPFFKIDSDRWRVSIYKFKSRSGDDWVYMVICKDKSKR